jgi:hypothetical protein
VLEVVLFSDVLRKYESSRHKLLPVLAFLLILAWQWRIYDLFHHIPAYGDGLEVAWGIRWYRQAVMEGHQSLFFNPDVFYPHGWRLVTFAYGLGMFLVSLPFSLLGNEAFAYNVLVLGILATAFGGMYRLGRNYADRFSATLGAALFTFWGPRWMRMGGHVNVLGGSAILPWIPWGLEKGFDSKHRTRWFVFVGLLWAVAVSFTFYYVWLAGLLLFCWIVGSWWNGRIDRRVAIEGTVIPGLVMGIVSLPLVIAFYRAKSAVGAPDFSFAVVNSWGANLNSLFSPFVGHAVPQMRTLATTFYTSRIDETSAVNLGLLASVVCVGAIVIALRHKRSAWVPPILLVLLGTILSLGPTLHWNKQIVEVAFFEPVNELLWQIGHYLKPSIFWGAATADKIQHAVPLPGFLLTAVIPFWEGARVSARFLFPVSVGFFLLVALAVGQLRTWGWRLALAGLLLFELWPMPANGVPYPPTPHPAFAWLQTQEVDGGVLELHSVAPKKLVPKTGGEAIWATIYHQAPVISGAGGVWPAGFSFLMGWLSKHEYPFLKPDFPEMLRYYQARYVLLHLPHSAHEEFLENVLNSPDFVLVDCFEPAPDASLWDYPICVIEVTPFPNPHFTLVPEANWSPPESWGYWAIGRQSSGKWLATKEQDTTVILAAFPYCAPDRFQSLEIVVQDEVLLRRRWDDCEPWQGQFTIPASLVEVGWNEIQLRYGYALQPARVTDNENPDPRHLSVGFTRFQINSSNN